MNAYDLLVHKILAADPHGCWELSTSDFWHRVNPSRARTRIQGWKIHVSAIPADAEPILRASSGVLVARRVPFKYVGTEDHLRTSLGRQSDPSASGKFITIYPDTDDQFTELLDELHTLLTGFRGPRILSDRQYRRGVVHYRYGQIVGLSRVDDHGSRRELIVAPDGSLTPDQRHGRYTPPAWVHDPQAARTPAATGSDVPAKPHPAPAAEAAALSEARIAGRFLVTGTIRHTNRGGVHRAVDTETGRPVVIKHCRAGIEPEPDGTDTRDLMRHEAHMLRRLAEAVSVPELIDVFDVADHTFLVETELPGGPLSDLIFPANDDAEPLPEPVITDLAGQLIAVLREAHHHGVVIGDVTPDNLLVTPDGRLQLIDLEGAAATGAPIPLLITKGYAPPEKLAPGRDMPLLADEAMDQYAAGAVLESLSLQRPRVTPRGSEVPGAPSALDLLAGRDAAAARLAPVVRGLTRNEPRERWDWERAEQALHLPAQQPSAAPASVLAVDGDQLIHDTLTSLLAALRPRNEALIRMRGSNSTLDPRSVQAGAAGVTGVLLQARGALPRMPAKHATALAEPLQEALAQLNRWWDRNLGGTGQQLPPGLYNGLAGACWAAADAALAAGDSMTLQHALDLAEHLPTRWHVPALAHGLAGTGIALLHLWHATGEQAFQSRARECADFLAATACPDGHGGLHWPDETAKPSTYHGFGVGTAGIGWFLLAAADACQEPEFATIASRGGDGLLVSALTRNLPAAGPEAAPTVAAWWAEGPDGGLRRHGWWAGPAGIGAFLLKLGKRTGEHKYLDTAHAAAAAVRHSAARAPLGAFWGIAGDGQFLLDLAASGPEPEARDGVTLCADLIAAHAGLADGELTLGDHYDFAAGVPGILAFLLRHRYGATAPWLLPDPGTGR